MVIDCVEVGCDEDDIEELRAANLAETQELTARNVNPMKLIMLLRTRFGIGRYEIQVRLLSELPNTLIKDMNKLLAENAERV